jgi:hypothetical protein
MRKVFRSVPKFSTISIPKLADPLIKAKPTLEISNSFDRRIFFVAGGPLSGKTTLMKHFVEILEEKGFDIDGMMKMPLSLANTLNSSHPYYNATTDNGTSILIDNGGIDEEILSRTQFLVNNFNYRATLIYPHINKFKLMHRLGNMHSSFNLDFLEKCWNRHLAFHKELNNHLFEGGIFESVFAFDNDCNKGNERRTLFFRKGNGPEIISLDEDFVNTVKESKDLDLKTPLEIQYQNDDYFDDSLSSVPPNVKFEYEDRFNRLLERLI